MEPEEKADGMSIDGIRIPPGGLDLPGPPPGLAEAVLAGTVGHLRARRRRRRLLLASSVAALYAAGLVTGLAFRSEPVPPPPAGAGMEPPAAAAPLDVVGAEPGSPRAPGDPREVLDRIPAAPDGDRPRLLREAGDRWLALGDLAEALDCYRQVLELSPAEAGRPPEPGESWLLVSMKQDR